MTPESLTTKQAAAVLKVHPKTLKRWAVQGVVPGAWQTPGGVWRFTVEGLSQLTGKGEDGR